MRAVVPLIALLLTTSAAAQPPKATPQLPDPSVITGPSQENCRDRIHTVREERGLQSLEREHATDDPLMIAAVARLIDGCAVLVMRDNTSDIRPLPEARQFRMMPAR